MATRGLHVQAPSEAREQARGEGVSSPGWVQLRGSYRGDMTLEPPFNERSAFSSPGQGDPRTAFHDTREQLVSVPKVFNAQEAKVYPVQVFCLAGPGARAL